MQRLRALTFILTAYAGTVSAIETPTLYDEIKGADSDLFTAFNQCDIDTMKAIFSQELEFYHDLSGVKGFKENMQATRELCARDLGLERTLIAESMKVYPVKSFGAIQTGKHTFCHEVNGKDDCGTFDFMHIWKQQEEGWKLHRVVSYGH